MKIRKAFIHMPGISEARYVSIEKAAARLDTSPRTIRRLIAAGDLKGYRVGKRLLRIDIAELDAVLAPIPTTGSDVA